STHRAQLRPEREQVVGVRAVKRYDLAQTLEPVTNGLLMHVQTFCGSRDIPRLCEPALESLNHLCAAVAPVEQFAHLGKQEPVVELELLAAGCEKELGAHAGNSADGVGRRLRMAGNVASFVCCERESA